MNGYDYKLKEQTSNNISDIASGIDDLRSDLNNNSKVNYKIIDNDCEALYKALDEIKMIKEEN